MWVFKPLLAPETNIVKGAYLLLQLSSPNHTFLELDPFSSFRRKDFSCIGKVDFVPNQIRKSFVFIPLILHRLEYKQRH
jgi:hypothetical protein